MSYSSFSDFLNFSREAKDLLGTRSLLKGSRQTGDYSFHTDDVHREIGQETKSRDATTFSWASCTETLQGLLEQYMNDPNSLSSFKQILSAQNTLQTSTSDLTGKPQEEVTCETPPPLLHRPPKRFLEESDACVSSPETKRLRRDPDENCSRSLFKNVSNFREEMFEKSRSIGSSSKQLRPPPPLLKQAGADSDGQDDCRLSPQNHYILTKEAYKPNAARNNRILNEHGSKAISVEHLSTFSPVLKVEPVPREIEGDCKSSLGGYAFDHTAMPKIVAVHSISKKGQDTDEWERNKAFIAKVKGTQTKSGTYLPRDKSNSQMARFASEKIKRLAAQAASDDKDTQQSNVSNERNKTSEHVSFERYVLFHLLSKFQGNVEQVKHVLKQNLLQEWLSYCQGNVDPRLQNFSGINFYELRKLYEIWSHLQGTKQPQSSIVDTAANVQSSSGLLRQGKLPSAQNHPGGFPDSQSSSNSHQLQAAFAMRRQKSENPQDTSHASQPCSRSPIHAASTPSKFGQHNSNGHIAGAKTESGSNENISAQIQEKICILSQDSLRGSPRRISSSSPIVPSIQQNRNATRTVYSSTYKTSPQLSSLRHFSFLNEETHSTCTSKLESSRENSVIKHAVMQDVPGRLSHKGEAGAFWPNEKQLNMTHSEASESRLSNVLVKGENRIKSTNSASLTLLHISQENSTANQNNLLPSGKRSPSVFVEASQNNVLAKVSHGTVQPQHPSKEACQLRTHGKDAVQSQETKANYLWRFKGGKLISDSIDNGKTIAEVDIQRNLAEYYSCNIQISQTDVQKLHQEHKKVCGAAASGQRCYCILAPKSNLQSTQERQNPIHGVQRMTKKEEKNTPVYSLLLQNQGSNVNSKHLSSVSITPPTQVHSHNSQATQKVHAGLIERCTQPYAGHQDSSKAKASVDLKLAEDTKQAHVDLTSSFNTPHTYVIQKAMANAKLSNEHTGHQSINRYNVNWNGETNQTAHAQDKPSYSICHSSHGFQLSSPGFSLSNKETNPKSHTQEFQSSNAGLINSSAVQESQPCSTSAQITQQNLPSNVLNHCLSPYAQAIQQSRLSPLVSQNSQVNQQADTCLKKLLSAQHTPLPNSTHPFSPDAQGKQQINTQNLVSRDTNLKQESKVKYACAAHNNQQPSASLSCLHNGKTNQQSNPSFHVSRNPARNQQSYNRCYTPSTVQTTRQCNVSVKVSQHSVPSVVTIAPKVNNAKIPNEQPASSSNFSHPRTSANKTGIPVATKTEKVKENEKLKEKQSSFHTPLSPRKQYNSLHQLAKKIAETRERFEMESIPWKKKILKSLEGVLMKKLKKIEKETGEEADLGSGGNSVSENTTEVDNNK